MQRLETVLGEYAFFRGLTPEQLHLLAEGATTARYDRDEFIFRAGEVAEHFYVIRHGKVGIEIDAPGRGVVSIQTIGEGEALGWSWLFAPYHWHFDARALEAVRAVMLDAKYLRARFEADHDLGYEMMKRFAQVIAQRLQAARIQLLDVYGILT